MQVVWAQRGQIPLIKRDPGRAKTHFYGALNLSNSHQLVMRSPVMNVETSALFLNKILLAYPEVPILLLWDRATWHRGLQLKALLEANPRLEIMTFPAGAPDLNPQEHVWKVIRQAISHNHTCKKLDQLADDFEAHLTQHSFSCSLLEIYGYPQLCMLFNYLNLGQNRGNEVAKEK